MPSSSVSASTAMSVPTTPATAPSMPAPEQADTTPGGGDDEVARHEIVAAVQHQDVVPDEAGGGETRCASRTERWSATMASICRHIASGRPALTKRMSQGRKLGRWRQRMNSDPSGSSSQPGGSGKRGPQSGSTARRRASARRFGTRHRYPQGAGRNRRGRA